MLNSCRSLIARSGSSFVLTAPCLTVATSRCFSSAAVKEQKITAAPAPPHKNISIHSLATKKRKGVKISMVTAYDFPSAVHVDKAGIDILLVGDSLGMVELGYETTLPVTMDDMIHHCKAVCRGCRRPLLVGDMPFGTYESSTTKAAENATRLMKETNVDCVKIEGGIKRLDSVEAIINCGIAVMGHIGLTPQSFSSLGGFKAQGKSAENAYALIEDAIALEKAGCFAMVIECVPPLVGKAVAEAVNIPVIGIGAGPHTDGQVLVYHDMLGMMQHHHHAEFTPQFCKQYATVGYAIQQGLADYKAEVEAGEFPGEDYSPYKMPKAQQEEFLRLVKERKPSAKPNTPEANDEPDIKVY